MHSVQRLGLSSVILLLAVGPAGAQHRLVIQGNDRLAILDRAGRIEWEMPWKAIHDIHVLENGHILVQQGAAKVVEIAPESREIVWSYDSATQNGNAGQQVEVHSFQPLENDRLLIAESGRARLIEVDRQGRLLKQIQLKVDHPHPHTDTRLVRKLRSGNYLVCHEGDGVVREYDGESGEVVWEYKVPLFGREPKRGHGPEAFGNKCFAALRLPSGNTLVSTGNGHGVLEVTPDRRIVWQLHQNDLRDVTLAWVTTLEVLPNGNYVIGNCHAGSGSPQVIEIEPKTKRVVWALDRFAEFGNNVSNTQVLDHPALR
jgi:outer membrane protein assembly factor BamB